MKSRKESEALEAPSLPDFIDATKFEQALQLLGIHANRVLGMSVSGSDMELTLLVRDANDERK